MEHGNFILTGLNVLIACIGVLFLVLALIEYRALSKLRQDLAKVKEDFKEEIFRTHKASQRIIASYTISDIDRKIKLLSSAVEISPGVFNGYNALGYAYLEKGNIQQALDAFREATIHRPKDKEGYFDLARAHLGRGEHDLCVKYLIEAIKIDPSSRNDARDDPFFEPVMNDRELCRAISGA
jgi:tetratricopeptide (TPR) repeat protein